MTFKYISIIKLMIQSYKRKHKLEKKYDTIVIGSGIGGLTAAALLAKEGEKDMNGM